MTASKAAAAPANPFEQVSRAEAALLVHTYDRYPVLLTHGRGVYVYDHTGKKYLDFLSGIGVNALGYAHPAVRRTLVAQSARLVHCSNLFYHEFQSTLAARLTKISGLDRAFFCNSGTEAWEAAMKLARAYARLRAKGGKKPAWRFLALEHSFHGRTFGAMSTTEKKQYRAPFEPVVPGVKFVRFNDVADLKAKFDDSICAVCVEAVQGEGGIQPIAAEFLAAARRLTKKSGALLLCDEIQSGLGRTGEYFAFQHYGVQPDIVTVAKPLANGLPIGSVLVTEAVAKAFSPGMHGTTFGGGPLACAVAVTVLDTLEREHLLDHIKRVGAYFKQRLIALGARHELVREVRGLGLMLGLELTTVEAAKAVHKELLDGGIIINRTHDTVLRFLPPFIVTEKHVDAVVKALDAALAAAAQSAAAAPAAPSPAKRSKK
jgi:acetylornithine aminotransferase/acetylornithine/N-succinyldiaminopimelate aminotransferase